MEDKGTDGKMRIKMDLTETCWEGVEWIHLPQNRNWWQLL
jgi:hypothetical protein